MPPLGLHDHLANVVQQLRAAYPHGMVPADDYLPLLAALHEDSSEENLSLVVAELTGTDPYVIANEAAAAVTDRRPPPTDVERVRLRRVSAGYQFDAE